MMLSPKAVQGTAYAVRDEDGVMEVVAGDLSPWQLYLLHHSYKDFQSAGDETMDMLGFRLTMWMGTAVDPKRGYGARISGAMNDERFAPYFADGETTEEIANQIVKLGSGGMWVFTVSAARASGKAVEDVRIEPYQHYSNAPVRSCERPECAP